MSWTDERVEILKRMWLEGKSASQIAKELGGVTRNAVIGKVHRLGLSNRAAPGAQPAEPGPVPAPAPAPAAEPAADPVSTGAVTPLTAPFREPAPQPEPVAIPEPVAAPVADRNVVPLPRRPVGIPGQPLPPQPSSNEISAETLASVREVEKRARKLTLMELTERTCKWPIGDPATETFWFCGLPCVPGKPYCEAHVSVAFQPMSSRRDRRAGR
ncbi:MAG: GcrA cell cycle regulator [Rhodobacteraceae bacterium]|nr:GcrA cell cycle regulator [Paracoccaceae bacterium]